MVYFREQGLLVDLIMDRALSSVLLFERISLKLKKKVFRDILLTKTSEGDNVLLDLIKKLLPYLRKLIANLIIKNINDVESMLKLLYEVDFSLYSKTFDFEDTSLNYGFYSEIFKIDFLTTV